MVLMMTGTHAAVNALNVWVANRQMLIIINKQHRPALSQLQNDKWHIQLGMQKPKLILKFIKQNSSNGPLSGLQQLEPSELNYSNRRSQ
jgi:hypothetical protein